MASAISIRRSQNLLSCQLCNLNAKLEYKCIYCQMLLCQQCKESHRKTTGHLVMCIEDIGTHEGKVDFSVLKCETHSSPVCSYCILCDLTVCSTCVKDIHKQHRIIEINEGFDLIKKRIKTKREAFEGQLNNALCLTHNLTQMEKVHKKKMLDETEKIKRHGDELKHAIDAMVQDITTEVELEGESIICAIKEDLRKLTDIKTNTEEMLDVLQEQIQNTDANTFFKFACENPHHEISLPTLPSLYLSVPEFIPSNIERSSVGVLKSTQSSSNAKEIFFRNVEHYKTDLRFIGAACPCSDGTVWLSNYNEKILQCVKPVGKELNILNAYKKDVNDIKVFSSTQVLLSVEGETVLKLMNIGSGEIIDSVYDLTPLQPRFFNITESNEIIVRAMNITKEKAEIIIIDSQGKRRCVYSNDNGKDSVLNYPLYVAMTSNRLIHVVDCKIGCKSGNITVINEDGKLNNVYCGHSQVNRDVTFRPQGLTVTPSDKILVADHDSCFLHVLNSSGNLLSFIKVNDIGSCFPLLVSFSSVETLYIASNTKTSGEKAQICIVKNPSI